MSTPVASFGRAAVSALRSSSRAAPRFARLPLSSSHRYLSTTGVRYDTKARDEGSTPPQSEHPKTLSKSEVANSSLSRTPLFGLHVKNGAKITPFAGYEMPLTYKYGGQLAEHHQVRNKAGLFDVSHMVQSMVSGPGATAFLSYLLPTSLENLMPAQGGHYLSSLSILLSSKGGILDDLIVTRWSEDTYYLVTNAGCRDADIAHITSSLKDFTKQRSDIVSEGDVKFEVLEDRALLALQGPKAAAVLQTKVLTEVLDLSKLYFGQSAHASITIAGKETQVHVARGGYTGEDGFEISIPQEQAIPFAESLLESEDVGLVGLAARDSLRLEAGMCLYGHDLNADIGPLEAGLSWVIGESRRKVSSASPSDYHNFLGSSAVIPSLAAKAPLVRRVGLLVEPGLVAREGSLIYSTNPSDGDEPVGHVTSGIPSPTLKENIAMGYVKNGFHRTGRKGELKIKLRNKDRAAEVVRMPFVKNRYYREPK